MKIISLLSIAATAFVMNTAIAQTEPAGPPTTNNPPATTQPTDHGMHDTTRKPTAQPSTAANPDFTRADSNKDGNVSTAELTTYGDSTLQFATLDKNADGKVSSSEWSDHAATQPDDMDDE